MADEKFDYKKWQASGSEPQPFEEYQMFACDWVHPGSTHEQGVEACIDGIMNHLPKADGAAVRAAVLNWGHLGREDE